MTHQLVFIPMRPNNVKSILAGKKTATSRTKIFGWPGDYFMIKDSYYQITRLNKKTLGEIAMNHFKDEGFNSTEEFIAEWEQIHPYKGFDASWEVYYHEFEKKY